MTRYPGCAALAALVIFGATTANAAILQVNITPQNPAYDKIFGGISFDLNTAAANKAFTAGSCGGGEASGVYTTFDATDGVSNGSLNWNGVNYSLLSSNIYLDSQGACVNDLDMTLTFNNGTSFFTQDIPTGGPYSTSQYSPSQMLATAMLGSYNGPLADGSMAVQGQQTGVTGFIAKTTSVPEPGTLALLAAGLFGVGFSRRRLRARGE
jgi:hypothetical protein